jgi:hypothetical protein
MGTNKRTKRAEEALSSVADMPKALQLYNILSKYSSTGVLWNELWRVYPLLGNDSVNTFSQEPMHAKIWYPLLGNG